MGARQCLSPIEELWLLLLRWKSDHELGTYRPDHEPQEFDLGLEAFDPVLKVR